MKAVVTGATGCLGMSLCRRLVEDKYEVLALGRNQQLGHVLTKLGAQFIAIDLQEASRLLTILQSCDVVFHCAALSSPWGSYSNFYSTNVLGTKHIIAATPAHARLVHVSSPSIYFDFTEKHNVKENSPLPHKPANYYVKSKLLAEELIDQAFKKTNLNVVTLRPRAIFGPYDRAIIPRLLNAEKNGVLPLIGHGTNLIDITYVDNVVESLILAALADHSVVGKKYNITNDEPRTLIDIITHLYRALEKPLKIKYVPYRVANALAFLMEQFYRCFLPNKEPPLTQYSAGVLALGQTLNIDAAKQELHYKPILSIEQGIRKFSDWYRHDNLSTI